MKNKKYLKINNRELNLPVFFPDATNSVIKGGVDSIDLENCKIDGVVVNTYHLLRHSLIEKIQASGGIHKFMNFNKPIISDSGGFQIMSLIKENPKLGKIYDDKIVFRLDNKKIILTPEKCIKIQFQLGSDIIMCLDDCTKPSDSESKQKESVERTVLWAKKCKEEFDRLVKDSKTAKKENSKNTKNKPLIFAIIQGGNNKKLRKYCCSELLKIGFDGYSFGGWPINENGKFMKDILEFTAKIIPDEFPKYAMGIGKPEDIVECFKMGYNLFDCVIPTREGRNRRLYLFKKDPKKIKNITKSNKNFYEYIQIEKSKFSVDFSPISKFCDCLTCKNYSKAYISSLFKAKEMTAYRLASIHNLRFYSMLMEILKQKE
jgi:queuine tRNA-ribosyltransferase